MRRIILGIILVFLISGATFYFFSFKEEKEKISAFEVKRGEVISIVSESGTLKKGDLLNLSFEKGGKIEKIFKKEGEKIKEGDVLAKLESAEIELQIKIAKDELKIAKTSLDKLLSEPEKEEVDLAKIELSKSKEDLENFLSQVSSSFDYFFLKLKEVKGQIQVLRDKYFRDALLDSQKFREGKEKIERKIEEIEKEKENLSLSNLEEKISKIKEILDDIFNALIEMREIVEESKKQRGINESDISLFDTQKDIVNNLISQNLSLENNFYLLKSNFDSAQEKLDLLLSKPKKEDVEICKKKIEKAQDEISLLEEKLEKTKIKSPVSGKIVEIFKKEGEVVRGGEVIFQILPEKDFQVEADIYEEDIPKIKVGNKVEINFPAFEKKTFFGKVIFINPVEKIKEGVVYYKIKIEPESLPENVLPGMSCDLRIITAKKENVLIVPEDALKKEDEKYFVYVLEKGKIKKREIKVGLFGENFVEILEGLKEGEKVVLP